MNDKKNILLNFKLYFRNKKKRIPKNGTRSIRKKNKIASIRSLKKSFPSIIILLGLLSLSFTIVFLIKEINPLIKNQRLKYLCTYELGNKKNINYKKAKLKLNKIVGDDNKFCSNFIFPKNKRSRFNIFPFLKDIFFRLAF